MASRLLEIQLLLAVALVAVTGQTTSAYNGKCDEHLAGVEVMPGAYVPTCGHDGNYRLKQCHGSTAYCWCVDPVTGEEVNGTRVQFLNPNCTKEYKGKCDEHLAGVEVMPGAYVPTCENDGNYRLKQCHGSTAYCWCVNPVTGEEVVGSKVKLRDPGCIEQGVNGQTSVHRFTSVAMLIGAALIATVQSSSHT